MKRIEIRTIEDLMKVSTIIVEMSKKFSDVEVWHPSLVWSAPNRGDEEEWEEIISHAPKPVAIRITTPYRAVTVKNLWLTPEMRATSDEAFEVRLPLLVALTIKRLIGGQPAVVDVGIDWDTAVPVVVSGDKIPRRRRRPRRR